MIGKMWEFLKIKFKDKLYVFSIVFFSGLLFHFFPSPIVQLPSLLVCIVFMVLMAIVLVIDMIGNLKDMVSMIFKKKVEIPVPVEVANLANSIGVKCKSFEIVTDNFNACVLPTGRILIGDKTFFSLNKNELLAVFAHEFAHHKNRHYLLKISLFALLIVSGYAAFHELPEFMAGYVLLAYVSIAMIPASWYIELEADRLGKTFVGADHMISALEKISVDRDPNEGSESHPPINARIRALKTAR